MSPGSCIVCSGTDRAPLFQLKDAYERPVRLALCLRCHAILPEDETIIGDGEMVGRQVDYHEAFWPAFGAREARRLRDDLSHLVAFYRDRLGPPDDQIIVDIGAGRGGLVAAL